MKIRALGSNRQRIKKIIAVILAVAGLLLFINTFFAYSYSTDWNFGVVLPAVLGAGCFLFSFKLAYFKKPVIANKNLRIAVISFCIIIALFFVIIEILIIIDPIIHSSINAGRVDTMIVLGCGIWPDGSPTLSLINRLDKAVEYYRKNPHINIIVSGGQGPNEPFAEALSMKKYLLDKGIPEEKILAEDKSTSTRENFEFSRKLLNIPDSRRVKIIFVTNDFHVFRSRILANRFGFDAYAISSPTPGVILFNSYLREFFAFVKSMLVDY
jgi:uncharacterized SAM-binding protein YcdF (DUF218 family)